LFIRDTNIVNIEKDKIVELITEAGELSKIIASIVINTNP